MFFIDHPCIRSISGVSREGHWEERWTSQHLATVLGVPMCRPLLRSIECVGLATFRERMLVELREKLSSENCLLLVHGIDAKHEKVLARRHYIANMETCGVLPLSWVEKAADSPRWRVVCSTAAHFLLFPPLQLIAEPCGRVFRRPGDLKRHQKFCQDI